MIQKLFAGLSDNGKKLMTLALVLVSAALFDRLLIGPTMSRMSSIDQEITAEETTIKQDLHFLTHKASIQSKAFDPYITAKLPTEEEIISAFLKRLEMLATKTNVSLAKVMPSTGKAEDGYFLYSADVECSGVLADVITFMHVINSSTDLMKVVKFSLGSKKADSDDVKATMTISKIIVTKDPMPAKAKPAGADTTTAKGSTAQPAAAQ